MTSCHYSFHYDDVLNAWVNGPPPSRLYGTYRPPLPIFAKVTRPGGVTHGDHRWPLPTLDGPGAWVELPPARPIDWGGPGLYSSTLGYLAKAVQSVCRTMDNQDSYPCTAVELWTLEYDGPFAVAENGKVIGRRARLTSHIGSLTYGQLTTLATDAARLATQFAETELLDNEREIIRKILVAAENMARGRSRGVALERHEATAWRRSTVAWAEGRPRARAALRAATNVGSAYPLAPDYWMVRAAEWAALAARDYGASFSAGLSFNNDFGRHIMTVAGLPEFCHPGVPSNAGQGVGSTFDI